jgi:hypothetical protein
MRPIPDKAEIVLEYPDKFYSGTFEHSSRFDAHFDEHGIALTFLREGGGGERKSVRMHIRHALFAEILNELAKTVSTIPPTDTGRQEVLAGAAAALAAALRPAQQARLPTGDDESGHMTPDEEVSLLHILE